MVEKKHYSSELKREALRLQENEWQTGCGSGAGLGVELWTATTMEGTIADYYMSGRPS